MAGSPPSPHQQDDSNANQTPPPSSSLQLIKSEKPSSRRLPPPCWSHDETIALIDAYRDKWYSLRRGNLKAFHWQEVADAVASRCPLASPAKTAVQCRHKMEKLRKRYRSEIQRAKSIPISRFISSWVHFKRMDAMEKGPALAKPVDDSASDDDVDYEDDAGLEGYEFRDVGRYGRNGSSGSKVGGFGLVGNGVGNSVGGYHTPGGRGGIRIKIPNGVSIAKPGTGFRQKGYGKYDDGLPNSSPNSGFVAVANNHWKGSGGGRVGVGSGSGSGLRKREMEKEGDAILEMVSAINMLADGFVKTEQKKMEMAREIEIKRMDMETKRLKMILESQERVMEAFTKTVSDNKKPKRMVVSLDE